MGRMYAVSGENLSLGTGYVLAAIGTAAALTSSGGQIKIARVEINQSGSTTAAQIRAQLATRDTAGTLTVTSATPAPLFVGGPASGISGNTNPIGAAARCGINSSADSGGTYSPIWPMTFNNQAGLLWLPTPEEKIIVPPSTVFIVRLLAAPSTTTGWNVTVVYEEMN